MNQTELSYSVDNQDIHNWYILHCILLTTMMCVIGNACHTCVRMYYGCIVLDHNYVCRHSGYVSICHFMYACVGTLYACMYACTYVRKYVRMYVCMHVHTYHIYSVHYPLEYLEIEKIMSLSTWHNPPIEMA